MTYTQVGQKKTERFKVRKKIPLFVVRAWCLWSGDVIVVAANAVFSDGTYPIVTYIDNT